MRQRTGEVFKYCLFLCFFFFWIFLFFFKKKNLYIVRLYLYKKINIFFNKKKILKNYHNIKLFFTRGRKSKRAFWEFCSFFFGQNSTILFQDWSGWSRFFLCTQLRFKIPTTIESRQVKDSPSNWHGILFEGFFFFFFS